MTSDLKINQGAPAPEESVLASSEHEEGAAKILPQDAFAEDVAYGQDGLRGLLGSSYVFGAAFLASLGGFSFGYDQGVISIINVMDQFHSAFPRTETAFGTSFMTAMLLLGAFIGCLFMPYMADKISRKRALTVVVIIFDIGAIMQTAATSYGVLVAGRAIGGIGVGTLAMGAPLYISEISPPNLRGTLLVLESISIVSGVVISFWITYGTRYIDSEVSFRLPLGLQMVCATILGVCIHFFPYSPRWLALVGRNDECMTSLCKLRGLPPTDARVQKEFKGIVAEVEFNKVILAEAHPGAGGIKLEVLSWIELFEPKMLRRTAVACGVCFFQQFSGINAFIYYAPTLFRSIGQSDEMSLVLSGVFNILQLVAVAICFVVIDKLGRRPLAILGAFGSCVCYTIIAALDGVYSKNWSSNTSAGWACVAMAFCFIMTYGVSYSPLGWCLPAEVYPNSKRAKGVALAICVNWLSNFTVGITTPPMLENIGYKTYVFFAIMCGVAGVWALLLVPETKGKTLEDLDVMFGDTSGQNEKEIMRVAVIAAERVLANQQAQV
ncbi:putative high-affinity glucose protein [Phaeoacremonium minimum UCRPA7]|uniref:Putative high-affinity glucose protein n=1 Tax=Phaeoacremonium minimum (strain UCR-PA7) TaxID=1286976 RepID=R8BP67_PHAM7|nr:putative high-affinity glucose protein [Phaeoacremonium minimum UCRPA7]EOO01193.1 putative high-affinity glucose protein [Phaeoacremonium minimum UCRPA7]